MTKLDLFLEEVQNSVDNCFLYVNKNYYVKDVVGDSVNNHRVPSVNQVIRFFKRKNASTRQRLLGKKLEAIYGVTRTPLRQARHSVRTDALDINEFVNNVYPIVLCYNLQQKVNSIL